jgi:anti-sigma factor RsiW
MTMPRGRPSHDQIQAYIDGLLHGRDLATVAGYLLEHPEVASEVETLRRQNEALKQIGEEVLDEPIPERLRAVLRSSVRQRSNGVGPHSKGEFLTATNRSCWNS